MEGLHGKKSVSDELQELFDADQIDRFDLDGNSDREESMEKMMANDAVRLESAHKIYDEYKSGTIKLSDDELVQLAFLFQHSGKLDDYWKAHELGNDAGEKGKWISAAAEDRWLLNKGEKQKWGTQFLGSEQAPMLSDEESGITDEMRREKGIPPRADQLPLHLGDIDPKEYFSKFNDAS